MKNNCGRFSKNLIICIALVLIFRLSDYSEASVAIYLSPSEQNVVPGEIFNIDIGLANPDSDGIYSMGIWLKYDSSLLNVIDYDTDNWVTEGINILDGPYHTEFDFPGDPDFGFPNKNDAGADGEISWHITRSDSQSLTISPQGIFATVKFQAEDSLGTGALWFEGAGTGGPKDTFVINGDIENILSNAEGGNVNVIPEPASLLLLGGGLMSLLSFIKIKRLKRKKG